MVGCWAGNICSSSTYNYNSTGSSSRVEVCTSVCSKVLLVLEIRVILSISSGRGFCSALDYF